MEHKGTVYFFTGLSGAGKTTVGGLFHRQLKARRASTVLLDGDQARPVFCEDIGYTTEERRRGAFRLFRVCKMLSEQGIDVVCCSISMSHEVREWNRVHIPSYYEIYIKASPATLLRRNQKGLYTAGKNVVGVDLPFDEPQHPDIVIQNDGAETPEEIVARLNLFLHMEV